MKNFVARVFGVNLSEKIKISDETLREYIDEAWYAEQYKNVFPDEMQDLFSHFMETGWRQGFDPNPYFDTDWYIDQYPDAREKDLNPLMHYVDSGSHLGYNPSPFFDSNEYLKHNPDVKSDGANPLYHFIKFGRFEDRRHLDSKILSEIDDVMSARSTVYCSQADTRRAQKIAILIPVHNNWHLTEICLRSLFATREIEDVEVYVLNDSSLDSTVKELNRFPRVKVIETTQNIGFTRAANVGLKHLVDVGFEYIYLLNNDTFLLPGFLSNALDLMNSNPKIAAVGSKLLNLDGTLQECGGIIWNDGTGANFGRDSIENEYFYDFSRQVDYCSGAAILIDAKALDQVDYFDEQFAPAYYEDTDLAFKLREIGREVWVSSGSKIVHFEGGSHGTNIHFGIKRNQELNRLKFVNKWHKVLMTHFSSSTENLFLGAFRLLPKSGRSIIWVDDLYPNPRRDSGSVRALALLEIARSIEPLIVFVATEDPWDVEMGNSLRNIGQLAAKDFDAAIEFLSRIGVTPWFVWLSRITSARKLIGTVIQKTPGSTLIFDTVDLHFLRLEREFAYGNVSLSREDVDLAKRQELSMIKIADITTVVSSYERDYLEKELNAPRVEVLSNIHQCTTVLPVYEDTQGIVFIGGYNHRPNVQGIVWFVNEVWPLVNEQIRNQGLIIAGSNAPIEVFNLQQRNIQVVGWVNDSQALVRRSRLSIAPLLTGAGVKGKIGEALSQGIPVVATSIATEGMHFESNQHGIVADTPSDFANAINALYDSVDQWHLFQRSGLDLIRKHYSIDVAKEKFLEITNSLGH